MLLVEDNPDDQNLILRALTKNKIANKVVVVNDGAEALDYLFCTGEYLNRDANDTPTAILLDLNLPKIGGLEVLQRIRADDRTKLLPVIIMTSSKEEADVYKGYKLGVNSYITKPIIFEDFVDAINTLGLYWLVLNVPPKM